MTATYWTEKNDGGGGGYEMTRGNAELEPGVWVNTPAVPIHRLAAVAWFGYDTVVGKDVHHRVPIPWLNVESNLTPVPSPEHSLLTARIQREGLPESVVDDVTAEFGGQDDG